MDKIVFERYEAYPMNIKLLGNFLSVCVAAADNNARSEVPGVVLTLSRRDNNDSLELHRRPSTVDDYTATSVYTEIGETVYEPAMSVVDEHTGSADYDVLSTQQQSMQPQHGALMTVPVYISLLSDAEADEAYINHPSTASRTDNQLSDTSETHLV